MMSAEFNCAKFHYLAVPKLAILNRVNISLKYVTRKNTEGNTFWDTVVVKSVTYFLIHNLVEKLQSKNFLAEHEQL